MRDKLLRLEDEFRRDLENISGAGDLENLRSKFLGRKGLLISTLRSFKDLPEDEHTLACLEAHRIRRHFTETITRTASDRSYQ